MPIESVVRGADVGNEATTRETSQRFDFNEGIFTARQTVFDFGKTLDQIGAADADRAAAAADLQNARAEIAFAVRRAFFEAVSAEAQLRAREESFTQEEAVVRESSARQRTGLAPEYDVTQARVRAGLSSLEVIQSRRDAALARERLKTAIGLDSPLEVALDSDLAFRPMELRVEEAIEAALSQRPEIRSAENRVMAEERRLDSVTAELLPIVVGEASYGFTGRNFPLNEGWSIGVGATVPLFDSFETIARRSEEQALLAAARARLRRLRQDVELQVRESFIELASAATSVAASAEVLDVARRNLNLARGRYGAGIGSILEVSDAHSGRSEAEIATVRALAAHRIARARVELTTGRPLN